LSWIEGRANMADRIVRWTWVALTFLLLSCPVLAVTFSGFVYEGGVGDTGIRAADVTVSLYGSNTYGVLGTFVSLSGTDQSGFYSLEGPDTYEYNNILLEIPSGATAAGAQSISGSVLSPTWIVVPFTAVRGNLFLPGNDFWIDVPVTCPAGCECLSEPAAMEKYITYELCSDAICGYEIPTVPKYCVRPVTTPSGPVDGTTCDDGNLCTIDDVYQNGVCIPGPSLICDDQNPGTADTCDPQQGCVFHVMETVGPVILTLAPPIPGPRDPVTVTASYSSEIENPHIEIFVNGERVNTCEDQECSFQGGPYPEGLIAIVRYRDINGVMQFTPPEDLRSNTQVCPGTDRDCDGIPNDMDNCPTVKNLEQYDSEKCWSQTPGGKWINGCLLVSVIDITTPSQIDPKMFTGDGIGDDCDYCPMVMNTLSENVDSDGDGFGDICDNCPSIKNMGERSITAIFQVDADKDGTGDACDECTDPDGDLICTPEDNCPTVANPNQANVDGDPFGDACDEDDDGDGIQDAQDNCPGISNPDQLNINNDELGDACDCWDVFQGSAESGVDCGGGCGPCISPPQGWKNITPIRLKGAINQGFIDIVFIPNTDYASNLSPFRSDIINLIRTRIFTLDKATAEAIPQDYKDRFNFYFYEGGFGYRTKWWNLPPSFWKDAPGTDVGAIMKNSSCCVGESFYWGPPAWLHCPARSGQLFSHEIGHAVFSLLDEYCGKTNYDCGNGKCPSITNIWTSTAECQKDATAHGWTNGTCRRIEWDDTSTPGLDCQRNFWRYDPVTCEMDDGGFLFGDACSRKIAYTFDNWPSGLTKGILVTFHVREGNFSLVSSEVVASHPDLGLQEDTFTGMAFSSGMELIASFGIWDPRAGFGDVEVLDEKGDIIQRTGYPVYRDDFDFTVIFPFYDNLKTFQLENTSTRERLVEVDLTQTLHAYCEGTRYEERECQSLDLDNDGLRDYQDSDPLHPTAEPIPGFTLLLSIGALLLAFLVARRRL
jgi:hypothetical protein